VFATSVTIHLVTAALCCTIAFLALHAMLRRPRWQPLAGWSFVAFVATIAVTSVWRAGMPWIPRHDSWMLGAISLELLAAGLLALVFVRQRDIVPRLADRARRSAREYDRAREDYERLLRHRIANPLAAVHGIACTLRDHPDLPDASRVELVAALVESAEQLTAISLTPEPVSVEEHDLRAVPDVEVDVPRGVHPIARGSLAG
jgi:signal transduction histidine kinase